jgi:4-diphosphocytidyl-2-C-methyl-D-erythritol kinase
VTDLAAGAQEIAYAKINLALHVRCRLDDGYHALETLFAFAEEGDVLTVEAAEDLSLTLSGPFAGGLGAGPDNLVLRAARALQQECAIVIGAALHLDKRLPIASGIGGGSADAAAALRLLIRFWGCTIDDDALRGIALGLGADVPACLTSQSCVGTGIGAELSPYREAALAGLPILLVNPLAACPTGPVFKAWDGVDQGPLDPVEWRTARNDLAEPATRLLPVIADVIAALESQPGQHLTRMSGSGATCFALFDSTEARDAATAFIVASCPDWWTLATRLR